MPRLFCCVFTLALWWAGGCNRTAPTDQAFAENKLLITVGSEPSSLDPHRSTGSPESFIMSALWEPLIDWNEDATGFVPAAAASWEISADGRTYTFHLRPDAKWSNGDPVTATDWVVSFQRWLNPSLAAELANFADPILGAFDYRTGKNPDPESVGIRAIDPHTLEIELIEPDVMFIDRLPNYPWFPVHQPSVTATGGFHDPMNNFIRPGVLVSNGPYQLTDWRHDQFVEVTRNPHYHGETQLDAIRFVAMGNLDTEERAYRSGQLHITSGVPASKMDVYRDAQDPAFLNYRRIGSRYLMVNVQRPPFDDVRVRRAFALALDRQQLVEVVLRTGDAPGYSMIGAVPERHEPTTVIEESVDEARALLAAAGYPKGQGMPPVEFLYNTSDRNRQMAEAMQQMWRANLGVPVSIRNEEWKVFLDTRIREDYQISRAGWLPFSPEPAEIYELCHGDSPNNQTGWRNPEYDEVLNLARREMDLAKRRQLYDRLDEILLAEMPHIPIGFYARALLVDPRVTGWATNPMEAVVWTRVGFKR